MERSESRVKIAWRAYELRPEPLPLPKPDSDYFKKIWEEQVYPMAANLGIKMQMPAIKPRSRLAHEASKWAASNDRFDGYGEGIFRAYFECGDDIGEIETLLEIAERIGLDKDSLNDSLRSGKHTETVLTEENYAADLGITFVPAFVADRKSGLAGVQSTDNLRRLVESVI